MAGVLTKLQNLVEGCNWEEIKQFCLNNVRTALVFGVSVTAFWLMFKKPRGIPPCPRFTLPIIGDLLRLGGEDPRIPIRKMRKQYGDIFSFYMGQRLVICMNGYEMIRESMLKNGDIFSDRPELYLYDLFFENKGLATSNGQEWKDQRKFALTALRELGFGKPIMEDNIKTEIEEYMLVLSKHQGKPFDMARLTHGAVANVIAALVFGHRFQYEDPKFKNFLKMVDEYFEASGNGAIVNFIPNLRYLPGDLFHMKKVIENLTYIKHEIVEPAIKQHKDTFDENDIRDYISSYLKEMKRNEKMGQDSFIDEENLPLSIIDLFIAGSETTATIIKWMFLYLIHNPDVQTRCYKEVQDVVGSGRLPSLKDRDSIFYTQAVVLEVLRISNIIITNDPHTVLQDVVFGGYLIPKGSVVLPNLDSVLLDEEIWEDPEVFRPERFLDENGRIIQKEEFIPFSIGRRNCPGESLAKMELFLFVTTLIQRFEFRPVDPNNLPTLKGNFGLTHVPTNYEVVIVPR